MLLLFISYFAQSHFLGYLVDMGITFIMLTLVFLKI